jgi:cell division protein FtsB
MRIFAIVLLIVLVLLQYRLWISQSGVREVSRLEKAVASQKEENAGLEARNEQLAAEVKDLKEGLTAVEERARSDLGMVGANETFYQVVTPDPEPARLPAPERAQPETPAPPATHQATAQ